MRRHDPPKRTATGQPRQELHREVCNALVHCIVSNRGLWDTVDVAEVKRRMEPAVSVLPWKALNLTPLWKYFAEVGTPDQHARETLLFFASRGGRCGIAIDLPPELELLSPSERAVHVDRMRSLGGSSGTFVGRAPVAVVQPPQAEPPLPAAPAPQRPQTGTSTPRPEIPWRPIASAAAWLGAITIIGLFLVTAATSPADVDVARYQRAVGDLCSAVELNGAELLCTAAPAAFADPGKAAVRVEALRILLDVTVQFVDGDGEAIDPLTSIAERVAADPSTVPRSSGT